MKLIASKSAHIDPNDMHFYTLVENNNESMDVNFVGRNNFGNNAYRGNFNSRPYPSNFSNNYGNSYNNLMEILISRPLILRLVLKSL